MPVPWILLSVVVVVGSLLVLAVLLFRLWRQVKALGSTVSKAEQVLGGFSDLPVPDPGSRPARAPATRTAASVRRR